jgi:hypothetical protein
MQMRAVVGVTLLLFFGAACSPGDGASSSVDAIEVHGTFSFDVDYSCDVVTLPDNLRITFRNEDDTVIGTHDFANTGEFSPSADGCLYESDYLVSLSRSDFYEVTISPESPGLSQPAPRSFEELEEDGFRFDISAF